MRVQVASVSDGFWSVFPVQPVAGRLTVSEDHVQGVAPVVVISQSLWQNQFGQRALDGFSIDLGGVSAQVVGVAPVGFDFPGSAQAWAIAEQRGPFSTSRTAHNWRVVGRLAPDVWMEQAVGAPISAKALLTAAEAALVK